MPFHGRQPEERGGNPERDKDKRHHQGDTGHAERNRSEPLAGQMVGDRRSQVLPVLRAVPGLPARDEAGIDIHPLQQSRARPVAADLPVTGATARSAYFLQVFRIFQSWARLFFMM